MDKLDILARLEECGGELSGEAIARALGVTRAAVWKGVKALKDEGFRIGAKPGGGYFLMESSDALHEGKIRTGMRCTRLGGQLTILQSTTSTNDALRAAAYEGAPEGAVIIADTQTSGKGRLGRSFYSPQRNGVYMSLLLRPRLPFAQIHMLTMLAAVCVCEAVNTVTGLTPQIKWVNDVLLDGRKLCGILSEAAVEGESGEVSFVVVGIGVNVGGTEGFPALQNNTACALREYTKKQFSRCDIIAEILNNFEKYYFPYIKTQDNSEFLRTYRDALCFLGSDVTVTQGETQYTATVEGLTDGGALLVRTGDGALRELCSGEVSVRG